MQRLGAIFIAICMVVIAVSAGAVATFQFGLTIIEASPIAFGVLLTLMLVHYQISRVRDRVALDEQMDDLTRLKLALTSEVQGVRELAQSLETTTTERIQAELDPILSEMDLLGSLVKQLAETCADLDERIENNDVGATELRDQLNAATRTVKELEELLRTNVKANQARIAVLSDKSSPQNLGKSEQSSGEATSFTASDALNTTVEAGDSQEPVRSEAQRYIEQPVSDGPSHQDVIDSIQPERSREVSEEEENAVRRALALNKIELHMQPIVTLPVRKPRFYEALTRLIDDNGDLITPDIFLPVCNTHGFMPLLDRLSVNEAFKLMRRLSDRDRMVDCFCNLSIHSMADSDFFAHLRELFENNQDLAPHIILEFSQADMRSFGVLEDETLQLLQTMGFRLSVDQVSSLASDFDSLARKGVSFAKIAQPILTHRDAARGLDIHPADFSRLLSRKGIELIATHVESESDLVSLLDYNIQYAQGDHFAPPKPLRPEAGPIGSAGSGGQGGGLDFDSSNQSDGQARSAKAMSDSAMSIKPGSSLPGGDRPVGRAALAASPQSAHSADVSAGHISQKQRTLGENPAVAKALNAMATKGQDNSSTRNHFRSVLAEAAGLMGDSAQMAAAQPAAPPSVRPGAGRANTNMAPPSRSQKPKGTSHVDDDSPHPRQRGQFIDFSQPSRESETKTDEPNGANFQRLIS